MKKPSNSSYVIGCLLILLTELLSACGNPTTVPNYSAANTVMATSLSRTTAIAKISPTPTTNEGITWGEVEDYEFATNLPKELVANTPIIAVVTVIGEGPIVNLARSSNDLSQPSPNQFAIGQVYQVKVEQYLRGQDAATLNIIQDEGIVPEDMPKTQENIDKGKVFSKIPPLSAGSRFVMFLVPDPIFTAQHYFDGNSQPWLFALTSSGNAQVQTPATRIIEDYPTMSTTDFLNEVKQLILTNPYNPNQKPPVTTPEATPTPSLKTGQTVNIVTLYNLNQATSVGIKGRPIPNNQSPNSWSNVKIRDIVAALNKKLPIIGNPTEPDFSSNVVYIIFVFTDDTSVGLTFNIKTSVLTMYLPNQQNQIAVQAPPELLKATGLDKLNATNGITTLSPSVTIENTPTSAHS